MTESILQPTRLANEPKSPDRGGDDDGGTGTGILTDTRTRADRPSLYRVIMLNDDYTPMEFVIEVLTRFFNKTASEATEIMLSVHNKGSGVCGIFPFEVAETKVAMVTEAARENEHPLQCTLERA